MKTRTGFAHNPTLFSSFTRGMKDACDDKEPMFIIRNGSIVVDPDVTMEQGSLSNIIAVSDWTHEMREASVSDWTHEMREAYLRGYSAGMS